MLSQKIGEAKLTVLFAIFCVAFAAYAYQQQEMAHRALIESYPPEFKGGLSERFVLWGVGLSSSTPLPVQANYLNSIWAGTVAMLFFSLALFSYGETFGGWLAMAFVLVGVVSTIKSWRTYKQNCSQKAALGKQGES
jgi:hypothetical protein